jgi:hypothetical protein
MSGFTSIFGSSSSANAGASAAATPAPAVNLNSAQIKKQIQDQIAQELAVANATELVNVSCNFFFLVSFYNFIVTDVL